jgi:hypothetical protein
MNAIYLMLTRKSKVKFQNHFFYIFKTIKICFNPKLEMTYKLNIYLTLSNDLYN